MIKGLTITPPVLGRISIGRAIEQNGKRLPQKDDQFTITTQIQTKSGWAAHPIDSELRKHRDTKLRKIPVKMLFNDPELNLRAKYTLFDRQTGRPVCVGDGQSCQRKTTQGIEQHPCPSPEGCPMAQGGACKPYGRLYVNLSNDDEFGAFIFRTTGFNSIRTLTSRLHYYAAVSNGKLAGLPLQLVLRGKSTAQSYRTPIYYVDITLQDDVKLTQAIEQAQVYGDEQSRSGVNQQALEQVAKAGYLNSELEVEIDEAMAMDEFYPMQDDSAAKSNSATGSSASQALKQGLRQSVQPVVG